MVGLDPSVSETGFSVVEADGKRRPRVVLCEVVRCSGDQVDMALKVRDRILETCETSWSVRIEEAPPSARRDVQHGKQAGLGWKMGYLAGLISMSLLDAGFSRPTLVPVAEWRASMRALSASWGVRANKPVAERVAVSRVHSVSRTTSGLEVHWSCGHSSLCTWVTLQAAKTRGCAECASAPRPAESRRDAWKELACSLARAHWPESYAVVVAGPRSRARTPKTDHELSGVSDACESLWIAASGAAG